MFAFDPDRLRQIVTAAAARADVAAAVAAVYADVTAAVDARRPACAASGKCCHFDAYGHDLFVTTLELAAFVRQLRAVPVPNPGGCPFQVGRLCGVHAIRPFGCRLFYCDPAAQQWQQDLYERLHADLRRLHESLGVEYFYVEWRRALAVVDSPTSGAGHDPEATTDGQERSAVRSTPDDTTAEL